MRKILPNLLTVLRVFAIPAVVASFYINCTCAHFVTFLIFIFACITDFFDGYLARRWGVQSRFGRVFDPAADKLIVISTLVMLVHADRISGVSVIFVIVIVCREILVSCMREFLMAAQISIPVSEMGKLKTVTQMIATALLILDDETVTQIISTTLLFLNNAMSTQILSIVRVVLYGELVERVGEAFLCVAAILSIHSMFLYTRDALVKTKSC
ncbi:CDP-diacylglycerol--glycerol-3-phosphate 3-phosphatidyltransferase [Candidatus Anaplasma sp. TIGMIC]|uniref:CDP-diacylglycerol--glycerol-3-phosphate 3-phosphatidyltransferase n=1 Tax=Candidatus Anaplasma sp. TIGMIC TaxID=3020713 RepID=UPI00232BF57D|nr:CDP-diacylglycerol--glycerol-3-phosphate 3-phosphatidyltransferase [Candidatus Anaplasma sp. TIGMIC]MDB1135310.1 CDP-diacylglycerol--glycerol-3-phosphate 3-phosphatidyltransferase [Candidatus Anaplasma sp. TIGMIC]